MADLRELDKLQKYLEDHDYVIKREDHDFGICDRHQITVFDASGKYMWDAICHFGSYGYEQGLLEIMGSIVKVDGECVEGYLTADDIISRLENGRRLMMEWLGYVPR